jgi:hypothetical protein
MDDTIVIQTSKTKIILVLEKIIASVSILFFGAGVIMIVLKLFD